MDNTAAQMNVVFAQLTFDVCKVPFHPDVAEDVYKRQVLLGLDYWLRKKYIWK